MGILKMCVLIMKTNNKIPHVFILAFCIEPQAIRCIILSFRLDKISLSVVSDSF